MSAQYGADHFNKQQQGGGRWDSPSPPPPTYEMPTASAPNSQQPGGGLTPYLTLPHHLSLTWLATPILSLIFVAFRLILSTSDAQSATDDAKKDLLASCNAAQTAASVAVNLPRYLAESMNRDIEKSINASIDAARDTMVFALTALEGIIEFIIDMYRSTFLCFLELAIRGALGVLIAATQDISSAVTTSLNAVRTAIQSDVQAANSVIQSAVSGINKLIPSVLHITLDVPQFSVPSLSGLENVTIPNTFQDALTSLNASLPTLADVRDSLDALIDTPFTALRNDINNTFSNLRFNASTLPVPDTQQLSFCGDMDTGIIDDLAHDLVKIARIGCLLLLALAILMTLGNCAVQWYRWKMLQRRVEAVRQGWGGDSTTMPTPAMTTAGAPTLELSDRNLMSLFASMEHPIATTVALYLTRIFRLSPQKQNNIRFFFNYVFHKPAMACFLIGFFGILSIELQLAAIAPLQHHYSNQVNAQINVYSQNIAEGINSNMLAQSNSYAVAINTQIDTVQNSVNDGVFGWVNGTIIPLNNTVEAFYTDIQNAVQTIFGGTVLDSPMQEFIKCFIGSKVNALENAFTFVQENFQVNIRQVDPDVLLLSNSTVQEAVNPIADAAVGGNNGNQDGGGLVQKIITRYVASLHKERLMFLIFLALWLLVVLMALFIIFWNSYGKAGVYRWKKSQYERRRRQDLVGEGVISPWIDGASSSGHGHEKVAEGSTSSHAPLAAASQPHYTKRKTSRPITTYSNVKSSRMSAPPPDRSVINLDDPQGVEPTTVASFSNVVQQSPPKKQTRHSRKLTADGRRPVRETLVPDAQSSPEGRSKGDSPSDNIGHLASTGITDAGLLPRLGALFGRKIGDEDEDLESPRPQYTRSASYESFGRNSTQFEGPVGRTQPIRDRHMLAPQPHRVQVSPGDKRKSIAANNQLPPPSSVPTKPYSPPKADLPPSQSEASVYSTRPSDQMLKNAGASSTSVPIHHAFQTGPSSQPRVPPPSAFSVSRVAPPVHPSGYHSRQLSDPASLHRARKSSLVDPSLVNFSAGDNAGRNSRHVPQLARIPATPDSYAPSSRAGRVSGNPFSTPFDDYYRMSGHGRSRSCASEIPPLTPNNPFENPFATAL